MNIPSLLQDCGQYSSTCGYCHDAFGPELGARHGLQASRLHCSDYQAMIDRGGRRSGCYCYFPLNENSCCILNTIRLDVTQFPNLLQLHSQPQSQQNNNKHMHRSHRKVLKRMERYLGGWWEPSEHELKTMEIEEHEKDDGNPSHNEDEEEEDSGAANHNEFIKALDSLDSLIDQRLSIAISSMNDADQHDWRQALHDLRSSSSSLSSTSATTGRAFVQISQSLLKSSQSRAHKQENATTSKSIKSEKESFGAGSFAQCNFAFQIARRSSSKNQAKIAEKDSALQGEMSTSNASKKDSAASKIKAGQAASESARRIADAIAPEGHLLLNLPDGKESIEIRVQADQNGCVYFYHDDLLKTAQDYVLDQYHANKAAHLSTRSRASKPQYKPKELTIELKPAAFSEEAFQVYKRYQMIVHKDSESEVSPKSYNRFLVTNPFAKHPVFGGYHYEYRIDGRLIAVAVVDILPLCLSSVYLFYDPDFRFLSLGVYTALREIDVVQRIIANGTLPKYFRDMELTKTLSLKEVSDSQMKQYLSELQYYYMGYYIHTCPKMRYKAQFEPSYLLCPRSRQHWEPLEKCIPYLEQRPAGMLENGEAPFHEMPNDLCCLPDEKEASDLGNVLLSMRPSICRLKDLNARGLSPIPEFLDDLKLYKEIVGKDLSEKMALIVG